MPKAHIWRSARVTSTKGIAYVANLPTEEVFSMPDKNRAEGTVKAALPLSYSGRLIEDFSVTFKGGRAVKVEAKKGQDTLKNLIESDEGAARLGEVALVPQSSPIAQTGILFYNTLFDENAASHIALGRAYQETIQGGEEMSPEEFEAAGGNKSIVHVDFMIGSKEMDIDGLTADGKAEPIMRQGEWAFDVE
jgi:aminopeptidase